MTEIGELMEEYIALLIKRGHELTSPDGTSKKANQYFNKILNLSKKIKKIERYAEKMKELLYYENDYVKLDAAFELLPIHTEEAENVLFELSQKKGRITTTSARITLERWQKGELHKDKK